MALKIGLVFDGLKRMLESDERLDISIPTSIPGYRFGRDLGIKTASITLDKIGAWPGNYRWFELFNGTTTLNFVMINVWRASDFTPKPQSNRGNQQDVPADYLGFTPCDMLIVGRGNATEQHLSLMLDFKKNIIGKPNKKVHVYHDGDLTLSRSYITAKEEVLSQVKAKMPVFKNNSSDQALLGKFTERKNHSVNHEKILDMLLRLAVYAHLLDTFRK